MAFKPVGKKSQAALLVEHFEKGKTSITGVEAAALFRIRALPRRISDLEEKGFLFRREPCVDSTGQRYVRYVYTRKYHPTPVGTFVPPSTSTAGHAFADR